MSAPGCCTQRSDVPPGPQAHRLRLDDLRRSQGSPCRAEACHGEGAVRRGVHGEVLGIRGTAPGQVPGYWPTQANPDRRSITQLEYEEAGRNSIKPQLVFTVVPIIPG